MEVLAWTGLAALGALLWFLCLVTMAQSTSRRLALLGAVGSFVILWMLTIGQDANRPFSFLRTAPAMVAVGALAYLFMFRDRTGQVTGSRCFLGAACEILGGTPDHQHYGESGFPTVVRGQIRNVPIEVRISYRSPGRISLRSYAIHLGKDPDPTYAAVTRKAPTAEELRSLVETLAARSLQG